MKTKVLLGIGMLVGCATGAVVGSRAQPVPPGLTIQRWQQFCERRTGWGRTEEMNQIAAAHGAQGWELVGVSVAEGIVVACFKRPVP